MSWADRWTSALAVPRIVGRIEARRPAGWIAASTAAGCGAWLPDPGQGTPVVATAIACGGLLAVAAIGRLPSGLALDGSRFWRWCLVLRMVWPVIGFLAGGTAAAWGGGGGRAGGSGLAVIAGAATALAFAAAGPTPARSEAAHASCLLGIVGGSTVAAWTLWSRGAAVVFQGLGGLLAGGLLAAALVFERAGGPRDWLEPAAELVRGSDRGPLLAMVASLMAMAGCYFLAPQFAWGYAALATGLFVSLAVPRATAFGPAEAGFVRAVPGHPPLPGSLARAIRTTTAYLGILVWPAVIAGLLPAAAGPRIGSPWEAVAWLGCSAAALIIAVAAAVPAGRGDAARAAVLAAASVAALIAMNQSAGFAVRPSLPGFSGPGLAMAGGTGVEGFCPSCKTSQAAQPSGPPRE